MMLRLKVHLIEFETQFAGRFNQTWSNIYCIFFYVYFTYTFNFKLLQLLQFFAFLKVFYVKEKLLTFLTLLYKNCIIILLMIFIRTDILWSNTSHGMTLPSIHYEYDKLYTCHSINLWIFIVSREYIFISYYIILSQLLQHFPWSHVR